VYKTPFCTTSKQAVMAKHPSDHLIRGFSWFLEARPVPNGFGRDSGCLLISLVMLSFEPLRCMRSMPMLEAVALPNFFGSDGCKGETICWICNRGTYGNYLVNVTRQVIGKEKASSESN